MKTFNLTRRKGRGVPPLPQSDMTPEMEVSGARSKSRLPLLFRDYQEAAFKDRSTGLECWLWGRQTGKSTTMAAWAVDRLITRPGRLVTVLSNSRANGMELNVKCGEICQRMQQAFEQEDLSVDGRFETMNYETRIKVRGEMGRIKVLAANPKTARGFSGDLLLDEFAFHEDSAGIWEAAEPILASNPDFLCRIASTPNGRHNMFYRLVTSSGVPVRRVTRTDAWKSGLQIFHPVTRAAIRPEEARALAPDKRAYDQNYECTFEAENMALLTYELISAAEREDAGMVCEESWSAKAIETLSMNPGRLFAGVDVGRYADLTVITVLEKSGDSFLVRGMLRIRGMRLPQQQERLAAICRLPRVVCVKIDMTGLGLGLYEYTAQQFGSKVRGQNFASSVELRGRNGSERVRAPEALATQLLQVYEDRRIQHPADDLLREDLRKPERMVSPSGRVSIAAARDANGHADHFWSLALAVDAAMEKAPTEVEVIACEGREIIPREYLL
jgi:phage FluMu gp28-like protein